MILREGGGRKRMQSRVRAVEMVISFCSRSAGDELPYDTVKSPVITHLGNNKKKKPISFTL